MPMISCNTDIKFSELCYHSFKYMMLYKNLPVILAMIVSEL